MAEGKLKEFLMNKTGVGNALRLQNELAAFASILPPKSPEQLKQDQLNDLKLKQVGYQTDILGMQVENMRTYGTTTPPKPVVINPNDVIEEIPIGTSGIELRGDGKYYPIADAGEMARTSNIFSAEENTGRKIPLVDPITGAEQHYLEGDKAGQVIMVNEKQPKHPAIINDQAKKEYFDMQFSAATSGILNYGTEMMKFYKQAAKDSTSDMDPEDLAGKMNFFSMLSDPYQAQEYVARTVDYAGIVQNDIIGRGVGIDSATYQNILGNVPQGLRKDKIKMRLSLIGGQLTLMPKRNNAVVPGGGEPYTGEEITGSVEKAKNDILGILNSSSVDNMGETGLVNYEDIINLAFDKGYDYEKAMEFLDFVIGGNDYGGWNLNTALSMINQDL
jgi:hypothetical protein